ncbi:hypothetical protein K435DRAFT_973364 [Dendrothele bispora CBS 962.96]|uniref:Uncharacterized protein n=1 Tax=Dendrothele bispora (strain CBS 962.96) TaxID=1314807 RepID=A0A4S8KSN8_DENBC|nr:hypothetical protein K435DRAFT_973364 [Dendrothele bispora CBS 962.96]
MPFPLHRICVVPHFAAVYSRYSIARRYTPSFVAPVQDPTTLVRDERIAASRQNGSNAKERSVNIFSNSEDASLQDTTFHITDKSKDAIEIPSRPTHEYAELVKAISSARGPSDSSMRGPMVSIDAPGQPPYFATGNMAPGHYPSYASSQGYPDQGTSYSRGGYGSPPLPNRNMSGYNNSWMQHGPSGPGHPSMPSSPPTQYAQAQHGPSGFVPHSMPPSPNYAPTQYAQVQHGPSGFVPHSMPPSPNYAPTQNGYSGYQGGQR